MADVAFPEGLKLPSQPKPEKQTKNQEDKKNQPADPSRRRFLQLIVAAAAAAGIGAYIGLRPKSSEPQSTSQPDVKPEVKKEPTIYDSIREKLNTAPNRETPDTIEHLNAIERSEARLIQIKSAYEAVKDESGKPLLRNLVEQRYGALRFSQFEKAIPQLRTDSIDNQIPFLRDLKTINRFKDQLVQDTSSPTELALKINKFYADYENTGSLVLPKEEPPSKVNVQFNFQDVDPNQRFNERGGYLSANEMKVKIEEILPQIKLLGDYEFRFKKSAGTVFRSDLAGPTNVVEIGSNENTISFTKTVLHEVAHTLDPFVNYQRVATRLSPEQFIQLAIAREKAIQDSNLGRTYVDMIKMYSNDRDKLRDFGLEKKSAISQVEFAAQVSLYADKIWISQTEHGTGVREPLFDQMLQTPLFLQLKDELLQKDSKYFPVSFIDFWERTKTQREKLAQDPTWKVLLPMIEQHKNIFREDLWAVPPNKDAFYQRVTAAWWNDLAVLRARAILAQGLYRGDQEIRSLFSEQGLGKIEPEMIKIINRANDELLADGVAYSKILKAQTAYIQPNPYEEFEQIILKAA